MSRASFLPLKDSVQAPSIADPHLSLDASRTMLIWLSGALALLSLTPAMPLILAMLELLVFGVVVVVSLRRRIPDGETWSPQGFAPWTRLLVFVGMLLVIALITGFGVSKEAGTALLGSALVIKFMEIRSVRDGRIVVVLDTLAPFVSFLQIQSPILLGVGVLALVVNHAAATALTEHSTTRITPAGFAWGRVLKVVVTAAVSAPLVLAFYMLTPRLDNPLWSGLMHQQSQTGVGTSMNIAQWTSLKNDMSTAFRVRFVGKTPLPSSLYFRVHTLWSFNGQTWSPAPLVPGTDHFVAPDAPSGPDSVGDPSTPHNKIVAYSVSYETPRTFTAPVLDRPLAIPTGWVLSSDGSVSRAGNRLSEGTIVNWQSASTAPGALSSAEQRSALQLPPGLNPRALAWAKAQWARTPTPAAYAQAVLAHFRTDFVYSLTPPPLPDQENAVDSFLFETKTGFCAHYASAFVTLMRDGGVPARVIVGYVQGEASPLGDYMRFRQADAHAWAEVWLDGRWHRFDPTAQVTGSTVRSDLSWSIWNKATGVSDMVGAWWSTWVTYYDKASREKMLHDAKDSLDSSLSRLRPLPAWALILAALALLLMGWATFVRRRLPLRTAADGAARVQDALVLLVRKSHPVVPVSRASTWTALELQLRPHLSLRHQELLSTALVRARQIVYKPPQSTQVFSSSGAGTVSLRHHVRPRKAQGLAKNGSIPFHSKLWPAQRTELRRVLHVLRHLKIVQCPHD